jgi:DNA-binding HxlR family transcriptional regulator
MNKNTSDAPPIKSGKESAMPELFEKLGKKWFLRILWEMRGPTSLTFRELQVKCEMISPTVLNSRLKEMRQAQLVSHQSQEGFKLTPTGNDLVKALASLSRSLSLFGIKAPPVFGVMAPL